MIRLYNILKANRRKYVYLPLGIYWLILFTLTSLPSTSFADALRFSDKIKHFVAYLVLSLLLTLALHFQKRWKQLSERSSLASIVLISIYGALDEIHQIFIPNRGAEFLDWVADLGGAVVGSLIIFYFIKNVYDSIEKGTYT